MDVLASRRDHAPDPMRIESALAITTELLTQLMQETRSIRASVENVERVAGNNAQRLDALLHQMQEATADRSRPSVSNTPETRFDWTGRPGTAVLAVLLLLSWRNSRQICLWTLRKVPSPMIILAGSAAGTCLAASTGLDTLQNLLGRRFESTEARKQRDLIAYMVLVLCLSSVGLKSLPLRPGADATSARRAGARILSN